jgi:hypothetical protein
MVFEIGKWIYLTEENKKEYIEKSRNLFDMDAIKEDQMTNVVGNYQMTDEDWELVKANFFYQDNIGRVSYSKEYTINALSRLTDFVAEQDQSSIVFERETFNIDNQPQSNPHNRAKKDVFLEYLNLFQEVLPTWYNLPPMLADKFQWTLGYYVFQRKTFERQLKLQYEEQFNTNATDPLDIELHEHPYNWMRVVRHFLDKLCAFQYANEYEFFRTSTEARLPLNVKQYCYLESEQCLKSRFYVDSIANFPNINAMIDEMIRNDEVDPNAEGFSPDKAGRGTTAIDNLIGDDVPRDEIVDNGYLAKLRWLFCATTQKLSRPEQRFVFYSLWKEAWEMKREILRAISKKNSTWNCP